MPFSPPVPTGISPCETSGGPNTTDAGRRRARIVGLGTPFGDDRAGWEVVALLRDALPVGTRAEVTSDPFVVADEPLGEELLIVIDACCGAGQRGSIHRFEWPDSRLITGCGVSSHSGRLAAAIELAGVLERLPQRVIVFAIEGSLTEPGAKLSRAVEAALPEVVARVLTELAGMSDEPLRSRE